jgi:glycosyltransferase involved in cell wall biosynthesis
MATVGILYLEPGHTVREDVQQIEKGDTVYINTVLPFGAALLGKLKGCRIIYHIHESSVSPAVLKWFLFKIIALTANELINVSAFVQQAHGITTVPNHLIYNSIDDTFLNKVQPPEKKKKHGHVLMVCSLKIYKGINEFVLLAQDNPGYDFQLVVNASPTEISLFFSKQILPDNLTVFPAQKNLHPFFQWADIILNLSKPDSWIETFGLTIIEGMAYGLPAIVPPVGGILEVIKDGVTGFAVDSRDRNELNNCLRELLENASLYTSFSTAATSRLYLFKEKTMIEKVNQVVF